MLKYTKNKPLTDLIKLGFSLESTVEGNRYIKVFASGDFLHRRIKGELVVLPVTREVYAVGMKATGVVPQEVLSLLHKLIKDGFIVEE